MRYLLALVLVASFAGTAQADIKSDQQNCGVRVQRVDACTRLLQSGRFNKRNLAIIYNNRGSAYSDLKQYKRAIANYNNAIRLNPRFANAYGNRANAYRDLGQYRRALADKDIVIRLQPGSSAGYNGKAWTYYKWGKPGLGLPWANKAVRLGPRNAEAYDTRGYLYLAMGRRGPAIRDFRKALQLQPGMKSARKGLAKLGVKP